MTSSFRSRGRERGRALAAPAVRFVCIVVAALHATMPIAAQNPPSAQLAASKPQKQLEPASGGDEGEWEEVVVRRRKKSGES